MYTLTNIKKDGLEYLKLKCPNGKSEASICLNQGARLNALIFDDIEVISDIDASTYKDNYASSILFPFANRIRDGKYNFDDLSYNLICNEEDKNNALHGLVYNKLFAYVNKQLTSNFATVTLLYEDEGNSKGFPFKYTIEATYTLNSEGINLSIEIINRDKNVFPFTLGWHPYFTSSDLYNSSIEFTSKKQFLQDDQNITIGTQNFDEAMPLKIKDKKLDDAFILENNKIEFTTPDYKLEIRSTSKENFLQLYTPSNPSILAVEPMTGVADSFNNNIGLQTLNPNDSYKIQWNVSIWTLKEIAR